MYNRIVSRPKMDNGRTVPLSTRVSEAGAQPASSMTRGA